LENKEFLKCCTQYATPQLFLYRFTYFIHKVFRVNNFIIKTKKKFFQSEGRHQQRFKMRISISCTPFSVRPLETRELKPEVHLKHFENVQKLLFKNNSSLSKTL